ncbi:beta-propeller domain-containing protein [Brevundimonas sp.]|uniref:beta-propeller domain-containing protein n=1 Tax=Brevundimonas sp. TaxID=1871086 RepID=UPI0027379520|nr:beta-propeller domain-containing protein [Brevundimonas sp.]MDP3800616.1 beta-propeller domain-containing protein [Brevundimonas sp.]
MLAILKRHAVPLSLALAALVGVGAAFGTARPFRPATSADGLPAFASEDQFRAFFHQRRAAIEAQILRRAGASDEPLSAMIMPPAMEVASTDAAADAAGDSITNVQEAGVDEGGIVKAAGDYLVVLRRGRLFTLSIADGLRAVDSIDVPPPGTPAPKSSWDGAWYDEMLVVGDRVVVIGYSYETQGTEILRFRLSPDGALSFEDASRLRASDYYSAENYASRLIGDELVLYNVRYLWEVEDPMAILPALTDETPGRARSTRVLAQPRDVFIDPDARPSDMDFNALHSVTRCDLTAPRLDCEATAILGPASRTFYVSPEAIYVWTTARAGNPAPNHRPSATVYRMPLDGGRPQAVRASGAPLDQFSFREDRRRGRLDVVVQSDDGGDAMWDRDTREGTTALLSLPLDRFGDGSGAARPDDYRPLEGLPADSWQRQNRFVGDHLLYAVDRPSPDGDEARRAGMLMAMRVDDGQARMFDLAAPVSRIEALGPDALIVVSGERAMTLTAVELDGARPELGARYAVPGAGESEGRSHGFFFRPDARGADAGLLGLPIQHYPAPGRPAQWAGSVDMLFLRRDPGSLVALGALSTAAGSRDDFCRVSCVDWYGASRPIFLRGRVFALMGYELVEGREEGGRIREIGRLDFTPRRSAAARLAPAA